MKKQIIKITIPVFVMSLLIYGIWMEMTPGAADNGLSACVILLPCANFLVNYCLLLIIKEAKLRKTILSFFPLVMGVVSILLWFSRYSTGHGVTRIICIWLMFISALMIPVLLFLNKVLRKQN